MKMKSLGLIAIALLVSTNSFASNFYVDQIVEPGTRTEDAASISELIKNDVSNLKGHGLSTKQEDADFLLKPKLIKLGKAYVLILEKQDQKKKVVFSSQMKANEIEEFNTVTTRLVRSVVFEEPIADGIKPGQVTLNESETNVRRKDTSKYWIIGFGPFGMTNSGASGTSYNFHLGYIWDMDSQVSLKLFYDNVSNTTASSISEFGLGGYYFLTENNSAVMVSADFGYGGQSSTNGFVFGVGPGVRFFRASKVNLEIQARYGLCLFQVGGATPSVFGLRIGLMF